jgi:hypothetical protein
MRAGVERQGWRWQDKRRASSTARPLFKRFYCFGKRQSIFAANKFDFIAPFAGRKVNENVLIDSEAGVSIPAIR